MTGPAGIASDVHAARPEDFRREVRSFTFWLDSVREYVPSAYGETLPPDDVAKEDRDALVTVLSSYIVGETMALEGAGALVRTAPNREAKIFLATQTADEGRHLEILTQRMNELGAPDIDHAIRTRVNPFLLEFRDRLLELVEAGRWEHALFAQNVILEAMEFAAFCNHMENADPRTRAILEDIVKDERRHIGFGENELGRALARDERLRNELARLRMELDYLVLGSFEHTLSELRIPARERPTVKRSYLDAVARLGFA